MDSNFLIIADDLSGAADCAVGFANAGHASAVLLHAEAAAGMDARDLPALTVDTDSRRDAPRTAANKALRALRQHGAGRRVIKKIDSTLRGNWATEVAALQPALGLALVAPAFPDLGRVVRGGRVHVHGTPLADTATWRLEHAGRDDHPSALLQAAGLRTEIVQSEELAHASALVHRIEQARQRGCQALVFDSEDRRHLQCLAEATRGLDDVFWVASAGLSRELAGAVPANDAVAPTLVPRDLATGAVLTIVGSLSPITTAQVKSLARHDGVRVHRVSPAHLRSPIASLASVPDWARQLEADIGQGLDVVVAIGVDEALDPAEGPLLARHLAQHLRPAMRGAAGLVLTGGETARAMLESLGIERLRVLAESEPGVVLSQAGQAEGGTAPLIATKAGAFGDALSLERAWRAIRELLLVS